MRKLVGSAALAACLSLFGAEAMAGGPFYLRFKDYCDCLTLFSDSQAAHSWMFGTWDWKCDGSAQTLIHGTKAPLQFGSQPINADGTPSGFSATMVLEGTGLGSDHADITATFDGVTNVLIAQEADYFLRVSPPCGASNGKPPLFP
jgi:hypothetical protein